MVTSFCVHLFHAPFVRSSNIGRFSFTSCQCLRACWWFDGTLSSFCWSPGLPPAYSRKNKSWCRGKNLSCFTFNTWFEKSCWNVACQPASSILCTFGCGKFWNGQGQVGFTRWTFNFFFAKRSGPNWWRMGRKWQLWQPILSVQHRVLNI